MSEEIRDVGHHVPDAAEVPTVSNWVLGAEATVPHGDYGHFLAFWAAARVGSSAIAARVANERSRRRARRIRIGIGWDVRIGASVWLKKT